MEYKRLRAMLNTTKNLSVNDPGEEFWRQLPQNVLEEVRQHKKKAAITNVVNLDAQRQSSSSGGKTSYHSSYKNPRLSAAAAIAAILLLAINVTLLSPKSASVWFDQASYQARIDTGKALPQLAQALALPIITDSPFAPLGFAEQHRTDKVYAVGAMLAASFAYLQDRHYQSALQQLHALQHQLQQLAQNRRVSAIILSSIRKAAELLQSVDFATNTSEQKQVAGLLAQFQGDYETFISETQPQQLVLFRAGIWVFNAALAVAAQDSAALNWPELVAQLSYLQKAFAQIKAPVGIGNSLQEIAVIIEQHTLDNTSLSDKEFDALQEALQNLNTLLS